MTPPSPNEYPPNGYPPYPSQINEMPPGYPPVATYTVTPGVPEKNGLATASTILGIISIGSIFFGIGFFTAIAAIITGHMALHRIKKNPALADSRRQAMAGLVIGYIVCGLTVLFIGGILALEILGANLSITTT